MRVSLQFKARVGFGQVRLDSGCNWFRTLFRVGSGLFWFFLSWFIIVPKGWLEGLSTIGSRLYLWWLAGLLACWLADLASWLACLPACLLACCLARLLSCSVVCVRACVLACLLPCFLASFLACFLVSLLPCLTIMIIIMITILQQ